MFIFLQVMDMRHPNLPYSTLSVFKFIFRFDATVLDSSSGVTTFDVYVTREDDDGGWTNNIKICYTISNAINDCKLIL